MEIRATKSADWIGRMHILRKESCLGNESGFLAYMAGHKERLPVKIPESPPLLVVVPLFR